MHYHTDHTYSSPNTEFTWVADVSFSAEIMFQETIKSPFLCDYVHKIVLVDNDICVVRLQT